MKVLKVDNVDKIYFGGYTGVKDVSFSLSCGERLAVFGEKGSGKSTLLKLIATLESPTSGSITIDGVDVSERGTRGIGVSYATSELPLMKGKTVYYNLAYPLKIRKVADDIVRKRVAEISGIFGLDGILDEGVKYLDQSTAGRVLIARAFMRDSDFYLFDNVLEPLTIADREDVMRVFSLVLPTIRGGIIYATDRLDEVRLVAGDNVVMLSHGYMVDSGSLHSIYQHPATLESIRLLTHGGANELVRRVEVDASGKYIDLFGRYNVDVDDVYIGEDIVAMLRPDDIIIDRYSSAKCRVATVYHDIRDDYALLEIGAEELVMRCEPMSLEAGDEVGISYDDVALFDMRAERRIISRK